MLVLSKPDSSVSALSMLVVDDCPVQRVLTSTLLSRWGIVPLVADGGFEAIRLEEQQDFDIILMDIQMPDLDGFETTRRIRESQRLRPYAVHPPIVAYTAARLPIDARLLQIVGIDAVLAKPCDAEAMGGCLLRWCGDKFSSASGFMRGLASA